MLYGGAHLFLTDPRMSDCLGDRLELPISFYCFFIFDTLIDCYIKYSDRFLYKSRGQMVL